MGLAQDLFAVGEGALQEENGFPQPPGDLVGGGQIVARVQGVRVGVAQDPLGVGEGALE